MPINSSGTRGGWAEPGAREKRGGWPSPGVALLFCARSSIDSTSPRITCLGRSRLSADSQFRVGARAIRLKLIDRAESLALDLRNIPAACCFGHTYARDLGP